MASQQKIQEYLQKHKIGALFEELMGKIVVDQPDDPLRHLIGILQSKADRKSEKTMLSKSVTNPVPARIRSGSPDRSKLAASFAGEKMLSEKDRQYNKPWQANSKPTKHKADSTDLSVLKAGERGSKMDLSNFDDIFDGGDAATPALKKANVAIIANKVEEARHPAFTRFKHSAKEVMIITKVQDILTRQATEEELLSAEVPISIRTIAASVFSEELKGYDSSLDATTSSAQPVGRYNRGPKANALNHKKKLEEMVLAEELKKRVQLSYDSGYEEHAAKDSAIELLEDVELLRMEGVTNPKSSGYKIRPAPTVDVKVSICARCARFLDGDVQQTSPAFPARASSFGQLPSYSKGKESSSSSRPASGRGVPSPVALPAGRLSPTEGFLTPRRHDTPSPGPFESDDEEFESVSQVTGPRHPVWQDDEEAMTPRKGSHMLLQSAVANKINRSSSHSEVAVGSKSQTKMASTGALRSTGPVSGTQKSSSAARRSSFQLSDIEAKKVSIKEVEKDENIITSLAKSSSQWVVPDYDTDGSTVYVTGAGRTTTKNYKPRAY